MKRVLETVKKALRFLLAAILVALIGLFIYNRIMMEKETVYFDNPPGQLIEVDGNNMHLYAEGEGKHTFVFMSGFVTPNPMYDFRKLYEKLSENNRIVVVEKFGYGFSDIVEGERDFDTILRQDREALKSAGVEGPYILCPHSLSGLEAELWAQKYPEEVEAIVGLDMTIASDDFNTSLLAIQKIGNYVNKFSRWSGLARFISPDDFYTEEEKKINSALFCRNLMNETLCSEFDYIKKALDEVKSQPMPEVPTIQFISSESSDLDKTWKSVHEAFADASSNGQLIMLDCGHYVYKYEYEKIAENVLKFVDRVLTADKK